MKKILLLISLLPVVTAGQGFKTTLKGTVKGRNSRAIVLHYTEDGMRATPRYIVPIKDGKFEQVIEGDAMRMLQLMFWEDATSGGGWYWLFFPDADVVEFELNPEAEDRKRKIVGDGGDLNRKLSELLKEMWKSEPSPEYDSINKTLDETGWNNPENHLLLARQMAMTDSLQQVGTEHEYSILDKHDDLAAYGLFIKRLYYQGYPADKTLLMRVRDKFAAAHPGHPYNDFAADIVNGATMERFVDFTAPDLDGVMHTLSEEIEGKVALIDLWASWCGPCIMTSRTVVPIYNEYKDKGFTVVGIARERHNTRALEKKLDDEKFPWLNLVELDDRAGIWTKYGVANAAGCTVLVDSKGMVVKKDPSADEIREYLEKHLK